MNAILVWQTWAECVICRRNEAIPFQHKGVKQFFGVLDSLDFRHIGAIALKWRRESLIEALAPSLGLFPEQRAVSRRRFESISIDAVLVRLRQRDSDRDIARD